MATTNFCPTPIIVKDLYGENLFATRITVEEKDTGLEKHASSFEADDEVEQTCNTSDDTIVMQKPKKAALALLSPKESPVTVVLTSFLKSTISFGDTGAEVTLAEDDDTDNVCRTIEYGMTPSKVTPQTSELQSLEFDSSFADYSLLVAPFIYPETPDTPMKTPFCGLYGCFSPVTSTRSEMRFNVDNFRLHGCIFTSLGDCDESGDTWQLMLPSVIDGAVDEEENESPASQQVRVMHNRALHARYKSDRVQKLCIDHHPFGLTGEQLFYRSRTFDNETDSCRKSERIEGPTDPRWTWSCTPTLTPPKVSRHLGEVDHNACYDSDPEVYQETRERWSSPVRSLGREQDYRINDQDEIAMQDLVQEMFNERWTLILHPENGTPVGIEAWLERGQRLYKQTLPPKLVWLPKHNKTKKDKILGSEFDGVDLLDIQRILEVRTIDRNTLPFAKTRRTFVIRSLNGTYYLEARSTADRERLVQQLKLIVARFGAQLVSNHPGVEDFFVPLAHVCPALPNDSF